jgi:hypothetical protein
MAGDLLIVHVSLYINSIIQAHTMCNDKYTRSLNEISTDIYINKCLSVILYRFQFEGRNWNNLFSKIQLLKTTRKNDVRCSRLLDADIILS